MNNEKLNEIYELVKKTGYIQSLNIYREMNDEMVAFSMVSVTVLR